MPSSLVSSSRCSAPRSPSSFLVAHQPSSVSSSCFPDPPCFFWDSEENSEPTRWKKRCFHDGHYIPRPQARDGRTPKTTPRTKLSLLAGCRGTRRRGGAGARRDASPSWADRAGMLRRRWKLKIAVGLVRVVRKLLRAERRMRLWTTLRRYNLVLPFRSWITNR